MKDIVRWAIDQVDIALGVTAMQMLDRYDEFTSWYRKRRA